MSNLLASLRLYNATSVEKLDLEFLDSDLFKTLLEHRKFIDRLGSAEHYPFVGLGTCFERAFQFLHHRETGLVQTHLVVYEGYVALNRVPPIV